MSGSNYCFLTCIQVSQEAWEQPRNTEVQINEEKVGKLPWKRNQNDDSKMIKNLENKMEKMQESINKDLERLKNRYTEINNTITEIKNTLEGIAEYLKQKNESVS